MRMAASCALSCKRAIVKQRENLRPHPLFFRFRHSDRMNWMRTSTYFASFFGLLDNIYNSSRSHSMGNHLCECSHRIQYATRTGRRRCMRDTRPLRSVRTPLARRTPSNIGRMKERRSLRFLSELTDDAKMRWAHHEPDKTARKVVLNMKKNNGKRAIDRLNNFRKGKGKSVSITLMLCARGSHSVCAHTTEENLHEHCLRAHVICTSNDDNDGTVIIVVGDRRFFYRFFISTFTYEILHLYQQEVYFEQAWFRDAVRTHMCIVVIETTEKR